jgi:hypothetical protein
MVGRLPGLIRHVPDTQSPEEVFMNYDDAKKLTPAAREALIAAGVKLPEAIKRPIFYLMSPVQRADWIRNGNTVVD